MIPLPIVFIWTIIVLLFCQQVIELNNKLPGESLTIIQIAVGGIITGLWIAGIVAFAAGKWKIKK